MSKAKRLKSSGASKKQLPPSDEPTIQEPSSTVPDVSDENIWSPLALKHWLKPSRGRGKSQPKVKNDVVKEIWDALETENFSYRSLLALEAVQTLESYLWPGFLEESSNHHVMLIVLLVNVKRRERLETWSLFEDRPADFSLLFRRILSMLLDTTLSSQIRSHILSLIIFAFQSLDCAIVRKECAPLVSISIWHNLSTDESRDAKLESSPHLRKTWRASLKRFDASDDAAKARLRFDRSWLYSVVLDFYNILYAENRPSDDVIYCERFLEFLSDLQSQLPTRRYVNTLLQDLHIVSAVRLSPMYNDEDNGLLRDLYALFCHYTFFSVDDQTGVQHGRTEAYNKHCASLARLQRVSLKHFKDKLTILALSNYASIDKREELSGLLEPLADEEIVRLADLLHLRTSYPKTVKFALDRRFITEVLLSTFERRKTFQDEAQEMSLVPTEKSLFDNRQLDTEDYDGSRPLALPKLNLQYLSVGDFLWRSLILYRCEAFHGIRKDVEAAVRRLNPELGNAGETRFTGFSKMALPSSKPSILEVRPALVGEDKPAMVRAEITIDLRRVAPGLRREWDSLRPDDVIFLLAIEAPQRRQHTNADQRGSEASGLGIVGIRSAEVLQITDEKDRPIKDEGFLAGRRRMVIKLDPQTYKNDAERKEGGNPDILDKVNVVLRRKGRENNFKPVLDSIRNLTLSDVPLASWLHEVFLGYGDPAAATYKHLPNRVKSIDFRDTFLTWQHLVESLPGKIVEPGDDVSESFGPPYVLESVDRPAPDPVPKPSKKRRRDAEPPLLAEVETLKVSTYSPPNLGPYPIDIPKMNAVRFTPAQVEAIMSGSQPGLTVIVGPPGTGKTDVATQIISNIYHNFPNQKTLLIAHSNQALNQLFAKIVALDIDQRHLLRLGHGEEELDTDGNFSKFGRVESFLENRNRLLEEVTRLAASLGAPGAHGNSAETAGYFNSVYVEPSWTRFTELMEEESTPAAELVAGFPFHDYFSNAPQPLFPSEDDRGAVLDIAQGCYKHISKIFSELADVRPFEILRREREKANYLLTSEARIIAMTSTHAAMRRTEIASLGFHYDNVVMEEAAQITEIENFIPLAMQKPKDGQMPLQRVVLCGDHFQNSPVIQNMAFRNYANLEQSLFSRLVRLGVPTINLDLQGRARPDIAALYSWRYPKLGNLEHVSKQAEFLRANAGFKFDYQFINVPNYHGRGESEPSPHFIQNLGEAEYAVAIYQYMRLLGYPASKISILTTYAGQRALVKDVLSHRCAKNPVFGLPKAVSTVDKYQGEQNDYIILSLTRTSRVGYLRDIRRMTVAFSRARFGLYILGRRDVFETCFELRQAFELLLQRPDKLMLVTGEMWPSRRLLADESGAVEGEAVMEGVEHLGQYVFEMTQTKMAELNQPDRPLLGTIDEAPEPETGPAYEEDDSDGVIKPPEADGEASEAEDGENE